MPSDTAFDPTGAQPGALVTLPEDSPLYEAFRAARDRLSEVETHDQAGRDWTMFMAGAAAQLDWMRNVFHDKRGEA